MYENDLLPFNDFKSQLAELAERKEKILTELDLIMRNINKSDLLDNNLKELFKDVETLLAKTDFTNEQLSRIIERIEVDDSGNVDVYLKLLSEIGIEEAVTLTEHTT